MTVNTGKQLTVLAVLLAVYALLVIVIFAIIPLERLIPPGQTVPENVWALPVWLLGLIGTGVIIIIYGLSGLAGYWLGRKLNMPGIYREHAGWRALFLRPMLCGLAAGCVIVIIDRLFVLEGWAEGLAHPGFPLSVLSSAAASIGEEILFRSLIMQLCAFFIFMLIGRPKSVRIPLRTSNIIAALAFSAAHLPAAMTLLGAANLSEVPFPVLAEGLILNSIVGLTAGELFMYDGLFAAVGVHFWADIVWHVIWPLCCAGF